MKFLLAFFAGLLVSQHGSGQAGRSRPPRIDKASIEAYVRYLFVWDNGIKVVVSDPKPSLLPGFSTVEVTGSTGQASETQVFHVSPDGSRLIRGEIFDTAVNPYAANARLVRTQGEPATGPAGAPVTLVMFSDFQCSFCKEEAAILKDNVRSHYSGKVRLVYRDYPLEQIHTWARSASIAGRCVLRQDAPAFWTFHDWVFDNQAELTDGNFKARLIDLATANKWDIDKLTACTDLRATEPEVNRNIAEAQSLGIYSTPTLFINGRKLVGRLAWTELKRVIDHELAYAAASKPEGRPGH